MADLRGMSTTELLAHSRRVLRVLRERGVIRSGNAPAGDYAETLVKRACGGDQAQPSEKSWDVRTPAAEHLQVKARVVTDPRTKSERQLSTFRSWDFDALVIVLFDDHFGVWRAARINAKVVEAASRAAGHVHGNTVFATDGLLEQGEDWTERLRAAAKGL